MCSELWQLASTFYKVDVTTTIRTKSWNLYCNRFEDIRTRNFSMYMKCIGVYYTSVGTIATWSSSCHWAPAIFCHVHKLLLLANMICHCRCNHCGHVILLLLLLLQQYVPPTGQAVWCSSRVIVPTSKCNPGWCGFGLLQPIDTVCHCLQKVY